MVLICQHRDFAINEEGINAAIAFLYQDEILEWDLESYWPAEPREGVAGASVSACFLPLGFLLSLRSPFH